MCTYIYVNKTFYSHSITIFVGGKDLKVVKFYPSENLKKKSLVSSRKKKVVFVEVNIYTILVLVSFPPPGQNV